MEDWEFEFEWLQLRHRLKDSFDKEVLPNLNAILFMVGIQELGRIEENFTKEEKQDLMHIAACRLLSEDGYYAFEGLDADGWPHYKLVKKIPVVGVEEQEQFLKELCLKYFKSLEAENEIQ